MLAQHHPSNHPHHPQHHDYQQQTMITNVSVTTASSEPDRIARLEREIHELRARYEQEQEHARGFQHQHGQQQQHVKMEDQDTQGDVFISPQHSPYPSPSPSVCTSAVSTPLPPPSFGNSGTPNPASSFPAAATTISSISKPRAASSATSGAGSKSKNSCHQCKSSRADVELQFCTNRAKDASRKRRCRKKFCLACLKRCYPSFILAAPDKSGSEAVGWVCPSCEKICQCASCARKGFGAGSAAANAAAAANGGGSGMKSSASTVASCGKDSPCSSSPNDENSSPTHREYMHAIPAHPIQQLSTSVHGSPTEAAVLARVHGPGRMVSNSLHLPSNGVHPPHLHSMSSPAAVSMANSPSSATGSGSRDMHPQLSMNLAQLDRHAGRGMNFQALQGEIKSGSMLISPRHMHGNSTDMQSLMIHADQGLMQTDLGTAGVVGDEMIYHDTNNNNVHTPNLNQVYPLPQSNGLSNANTYNGTTADFTVFSSHSGTAQADTPDASADVTRSYSHSISSTYPTPNSALTPAPHSGISSTLPSPTPAIVHQLPPISLTMQPSSLQQAIQMNVNMTNDVSQTYTTRLLPPQHHSNNSTATSSNPGSQNNTLQLPPNSSSKKRKHTLSGEMSPRFTASILSTATTLTSTTTAPNSLSHTRNTSSSNLIMDDSDELLESEEKILAIEEQLKKLQDEQRELLHSREVKRIALGMKRQAMMRDGNSSTPNSNGNTQELPAISQSHSPLPPAHERHELSLEFQEQLQVKNQQQQIQQQQQQQASLHFSTPIYKDPNQQHNINGTIHISTGQPQQQQFSSFALAPASSSSSTSGSSGGIMNGDTFNFVPSVPLPPIPSARQASQPNQSPDVPMRGLRISVDSNDPTSNSIHMTGGQPNSATGRKRQMSSSSANGGAPPHPYNALSPSHGGLFGPLGSGSSTNGSGSSGSGGNSTNNPLHTGISSPSFPLFGTINSPSIPQVPGSPFSYNPAQMGAHLLANSILTPLSPASQPRFALSLSRTGSLTRMQMDTGSATGLTPAGTNLASPNHVRSSSSVMMSTQAWNDHITTRFGGGNGSNGHSQNNSMTGLDLGHGLGYSGPSTTTNLFHSSPLHAGMTMSDVQQMNSPLPFIDECME